jgi:hypothetical protein
MNNKLAARDARDDRGLLARILDTPRLELIVPQLPAEMLERVIQTCGLEDCAELVAMATPDQLQRVFDLDLWRPSRPGDDERFDADRFGVWLEVMMAGGSAVAAEKVAGIDVDLVIAALAQYVLVFDVGTVSFFETTDGDLIDNRRGNRGEACEVAGYLVEAKRPDAWDAIVALLFALHADHPEYFHRVMRGCRNLSNAGFEIDALRDLLDNNEQDMFDLAMDRETRREKKGFVTPAQARAFLQSARQVDRAAAAPPPPSPLAQAYFRAVEWPLAAEPSISTSASGLLPAADPSNDPEETSRAVAAFVEVLLDEGILPRPPRALLNARRDNGSRSTLIEAQLRSSLDINPLIYSTRTEELAYLANTLLAGCSIQERPFTEREASDAAMAICNLGLENWPRQWVTHRSHGLSAVENRTELPEHFLVDHDLISAFELGWAFLHDEVCMKAAKRLIEVLGELRCDDGETQSSLNTLRFDLKKHVQTGRPWAARESLDVIAIFDLPAWATLLGLIDECPVMHAALSASSGTRSIDASAFTFISENRQISTVHQFLRSLPDTLSR